MFRIETPRLVLRPITGDDRVTFERFVADADMMRYISGAAWDAEQVDEFFARQARNLAECGYCVGAVTLRDSGLMIGTAGIQPQRLSGDDELAWWIAREWQRRGFATEIGAACLRYALDVLGRDRIVAIADPDNRASLLVMERIGMRYLDSPLACELEARYPGKPVARYIAEQLPKT